MLIYLAGVEQFFEILQILFSMANFVIAKTSRISHYFIINVLFSCISSKRFVFYFAKLSQLTSVCSLVKHFRLITDSCG